jgi:hypothetical protein
MVNVDCAGRQDRATTTSETHPYIPPSKTRNCYLNDPNNRGIGFDSSLCGTSGDRACRGSVRFNGNPENCIPDNHGGYCKLRNNYYVSRGSIFSSLSQDELLNRYRGASDTNETSREVDRALNNQERKFTNRIRELQIMGKDPLIQKKDSKKDDKNEVHSFISDMLFNIGIGISFVIFLISICIILIQNKII